MIKRKNIALYAFTFLATLLFGYSNVFASFDTNHTYKNVDGTIGSPTTNTGDGTRQRVEEMYWHCEDFSNCRIKNQIINLHYFRNNNTKEDVRAYCIDPQKNAASYSYNTYKIQEVLDPSKAIDRAIIYILNADVSKYNGDYTGEINDYTVKSSALRALIPFTKHYNVDYVINNYKDKDGTFHFAYAYALLNSGLYWITDYLTLDEINAIFGEQCGGSCDYAHHDENNKEVRADGYVTPKELYERTAVHVSEANHDFNENYKKFHYSNNKSNRQNTTRINDNNFSSVVRSLLVDALKEAAKDESSAFKSKEVNVVQKLELDKTNKYENGVYTREFRFMLSFKNFKNSEIKDDKITLDVYLDDNGSGVTISSLQYAVGSSFSDENLSWKNLDGANLKDVINSDDVVIAVKGTLSSTRNNAESIKLDFSATASYKDKSIPSAALLTTTEQSNNYQRFFILDREPGSDDVRDNIDLTIIWPPTGSICENDPGTIDEDSDIFKEWIEQCCYPSDEPFNVIDACEEANNDEDKEKYCGYKEKYCSLCNTDIEVPQTCVEFDDDGTFEGNIDGADMNATIDGPDALSICTKDSAGNSRETSETKGNRYCSVQCKEDYDISLPRGKYVTSGRYFELALKMTGTKTCSTDSIDFEEFRQDHDRLYNMIKSGNTDKKIIDEYNDIVSDIKECTNFNVDYSMNPEISYTYDEEEYIEKFGQDEFKFINVQELEGASSEKYCTGFDIDAKGDKLTGCHENAGLIGIAGLDCSSGSCKDTTLNLNKTKYVVRSVQKAALYAPKTEFYSKYITGEIKTNVTSGVANYSRVAKKVHTDLLGKDVIADVNGVPISLKTNMGIYNYNFKFSNLGEFYDQTKDGKLVLGRILGSKGSVALTDGETEFKGTYLCHYIVNCPECYSICVEDEEKGYTCKLPTKEQCPECYSHGTTVFDSNLGLLASAHNVSLINPFNGRTAGANWNAETNTKAKAALDEITTNGENIYSEPEYSFTFTPAVISYLKGENAKANGDYLNDTMTCKNYSDRYKGTDKYQEALEHDYKVCTSDILRKLKDFDVEVQIDSEEKFTSWLDSDYCKENVCAIVGEPFGPAWK